MRRVTAALADILRIGTALLVALGGVASFSVATGAGRFTSYAGRSDVAATMMLATGIALVVAGLATSMTLGAGGDLALLVAVSWLAMPLIGWVEGPPVVRALALFLSGFTLPLVLHLLVVLGPRSAPLLRAAVVVYAEVTLVGLLLGLFRDPYLDPSCFANCSVNPFLLRSFPGIVRAVGAVHPWFVVGAGGLLVALATYRLVKGRRSPRKHISLVVLASSMFGAIVVTQALFRLGGRGEDPFDDVLFGLYLASGTALLTLAGGLVSVAVRTAGKRRALSHLTAALAGMPAPGGLEAALGEAVGDSDLRLAYRVNGSGSLVGAGGEMVTQALLRHDQRTTTLMREGVPIAVVTHSKDVAHLEDQLGSSVLMGLENERLQAEVLARLGELRASRERIVEAGDRERRRLERDLHDGAQQSLLALSYDIRMASVAAGVEADPRTEASVRQATELTAALLQDLRELARGIFPSVLVEVGLVAALRSFADLAAIPVELNMADLGRQPGPVEAAAYFGVVEAVEDASRRGATSVRVTMEHDQHQLIAKVDDDGTARAATLVEVTDRVGALGGSTTLGPTAFRLEIPCA